MQPSSYKNNGTGILTSVAAAHIHSILGHLHGSQSAEEQAAFDTTGPHERGGGRAARHPRRVPGRTRALSIPQLMARQQASASAARRVDQLRPVTPPGRWSTPAPGRATTAGWRPRTAPPTCDRWPAPTPAPRAPTDGRGRAERRGGATVTRRF